MRLCLREQFDQAVVKFRKFTELTTYIVVHFEAFTLNWRHSHDLCSFVKCLHGLKKDLILS